MEDWLVLSTLPWSPGNGEVLYSVHLVYGPKYTSKTEKNEIARISNFLRLSKQCQLHVDVMTVLHTADSLRLVAEHISRVRTISIRPGPSDTFTALQGEQWKLA